MIDLRPHSKCPLRSPEAASLALKEILKGKIVCELGCAEGDNLAFMSRFAAKVFGLENLPRRYKVAQKRGLDVIVADYRTSEIPLADVYYFWPDDGEKDNEWLVEKILAKPDFNGTIVVAGDKNFAPEVPSWMRCAALGRIVEAPFNEGSGFRESGVWLLAVLEAEEARCRLQERKNSA